MRRVLRLLPLSLCGCASVSLPAGSTAASEMRHVWTVFFAVGVAVYAIVVLAVLLPPLIWRRRDDRLPEQSARNVPVETATVAIPLVIVCALFWLTFRVEASVQALAPAPTRTIDVTAFRWSYRFRYRDGVEVSGTPQAPPQLVLPRGERVRFTVTSADVVHTFWIPEFLYQTNATPGVVNVFDVVPTRDGTFLGKCAEFCGLEHAHMTFTVRVVEPAAYRAWLAAQPRRAARS